MPASTFRQTEVVFDTINLDRFKGGLVKVITRNPITLNRVWSHYYSEIDQIDGGNGKISVHTSGKLMIHKTIRQEYLVQTRSTFLRQSELFEFDTPSKALQIDQNTFQFDLGCDDELPNLLRISSNNGKCDILHALQKYWTKC